MKRVLIADDETAHALKETLHPLGAPYGIEFDVAVDGEECLQVAEDIHPDLIVLDVGLPIFDGYEVIQKLSEHGVVTRVLMMSGSKTDLDSAIRGVRAGACDYVLKGSIDAVELLKRIRRFLALENTTNVSLAALSPLQQQLVSDAARQKEEYTKLHKKYSELVEALKVGQRRTVTEILQKLTFVLVALAGTIVLRNLGFASSGVQLGAFFVALLLLLLLPTDKIISVTTTFFRAQMDPQRPQAPEGDGTKP